MNIGKSIARLIRAGRTDISAWLLIAFVFQLVLPIYIFSIDGADRDFQSALRNSICRVDVASQASNDPQERNHTDSFVCEWCVVSCDRALFVDLFLGDYLPLPSHNLLALDATSRDFFLITPVLNYISAPRAPPFSLYFS